MGARSVRLIPAPPLPARVELSGAVLGLQTIYTTGSVELYPLLPGPRLDLVVFYYARGTEVGTPG